MDRSMRSLNVRSRYANLIAYRMLRALGLKWAQIPFRQPATSNQQPIAVTGNQSGAGAVLTGRRRWEQRAIRGGLARLTLPGPDIATRQCRRLAIRVGLAL